MQSYDLEPLPSPQNLAAGGSRRSPIVEAGLGPFSPFSQEAYTEVDNTYVKLFLLDSFNSPMWPVSVNKPLGPPPESRHCENCLRCLYVLPQELCLRGVSHLSKATHFRRIQDSHWNPSSEAKLLSCITTSPLHHTSGSNLSRASNITRQLESKRWLSLSGPQPPHL